MKTVHYWRCPHCGYMESGSDELRVAASEKRHIDACPSIPKSYVSTVVTETFLGESGLGGTT